MTTTLRTLAAEYSVETPEIAATLDLGADYSETAEIPADVEAEYREILDIARDQDEREGHVFVAEYAEVDPTITIVHDGEDDDLLIVNGETLPAILEHDEMGEEWEPAVMDAALTQAGWVRVSEWDTIARTAQVRRA